MSGDMKSGVVYCSSSVVSHARRAGELSCAKIKWHDAYITNEINKGTTCLHRAFIPVFRYVKVIKIHQDFPQSYSHKCAATFFMVHSVHSVVHVLIRCSPMLSTVDENNLVSHHWSDGWTVFMWYAHCVWCSFLKLYIVLSFVWVCVYFLHLRLCTV